METTLLEQVGIGRKTLPLDAPIARVTVFEDRALVVRVARTQLEVGFVTLEVPELTPLAVERSLQARALSPGLEVLDVQLVREQVTKFAHPDVVELEQRRKTLTLEREKLDAAHLRISTRLFFQQHRLQDLERRFDVSVPRGLDPSPYLEAIDALWSGLESDQQALQVLTEQQTELNQALTEVVNALQGSGRPAELRYLARVRVQVRVREAGQQQLELHYQTPCALWRPEHVARLSGFRPDAGAGAGTLRFSTQAVIWQATGEDWNAVQLTCSTARPGRLSTPPLLSDDVLSSRRKPEPRTVVAEVRETEVQTSGLGSAQAASELPGVDDGGDPLSFMVSQPISVPSTGRPFRAPLTGFDCPATGGYLCMPERLPLALLRVNLVNRGARPILAGPVVLYRDGGYVGRSQVAFVASQERFRLSFGSLNGVRVRRNQQVKREETRLTGFQTITLKLELDLSNHSDEPVSLELVERIPVSELEDVKVTLSRGAPGRVDGDGMVSWNVALEPGAMLSQELEVKIEAPARVSLPY